MRYVKTIYIEVEADSIKAADDQIHAAVGNLANGEHGITDVDEGSDDTARIDNDEEG